MFITVHAAASAVVGKEISSPIIAFLASLLLHFVFDLIPHGDHEFCKKFFGLQFKKPREEERMKAMAVYNILDDVALVFFLLFLFKNFDWAKNDNVIAAIVGGVIPDLLVGLYMASKSKILKWFFNLHHKNHMLILNKLQRDLPLKVGIAMQFVVFAGLLLIISLI